MNTNWFHLYQFWIVINCWKISLILPILIFVFHFVQERASVWLDQGTSQHVSSNPMNSEVSRGTSSPSWNGNERLPGTVLLARARLLERLRGVSLSENGSVLCKLCLSWVFYDPLCFTYGMCCTNLCLLHFITEFDGYQFDADSKLTHIQFLVGMRKKNHQFYWKTIIWDYYMGYAMCIENRQHTVIV